MHESNGSSIGQSWLLCVEGKVGCLASDMRLGASRCDFVLIFDMLNSMDVGQSPVRQVWFVSVSL